MTWDNRYGRGVTAAASRRATDGDGADRRPLYPSTELEAVSSAVLAVTQQLSVREVLQTIVAAARSLLDAEYAALGVPDEAGTFAEFVADGVTDEQWRAIGPVPRQHGMLGAILRERRSQLLTDVRADPRYRGWPAAHPIIKDFLGVPILSGGADGEILGAIYLGNRRAAGGFSGDDERVLRVLAAHAAIALTNARLYERSRELTIVEERQRIARELHDAVAQKLFSLRLTAEAARALVVEDPDRAAAELETVRRLAADALDELHQVVIELRPADLAGDGLVAVLRKQVDILNRVHDAKVTIVGGEWRRLPLDQEEGILRVVQEALHNALRHAAASTITVRLEASATDGVRVAVVDDGVGFDMSAGPAGAHRLGLASMRDRARAMGCRLTVSSHPGRGTTVALDMS